MSTQIASALRQINRRRFAATLPGLAGGAWALAGCQPGPADESYAALAARTWRVGPLTGFDAAGLGQELVRHATLAASSHNTQCWKFALGDRAVTLMPDLSRRCPAVDPDDHHLFVSLGCATENLAHAALAHGVHAEATFDTTAEAAAGAVRIALSTVPAQASALYQAIATRQCTRGDYDAQPLARDELALLERAGTSSGVRLLLITDRPAVERLTEQVVQANTAQMADAAFVKELKAWIRFNGAHAVRTRDGLFSVASGNPAVPTWIGERAFGWVFTPKGENEKYVRQMRSSAGLAVFVGAAADKAHWVEVGRCYERFALQATALGIRNAFLNQPVEVAALRPAFATSLGLGTQRPDLVVRFGRGAALPRSLRRPVQAVLV